MQITVLSFENITTISIIYTTITDICLPTLNAGVWLTDGRTNWPMCYINIATGSYVYQSWQWVSFCEPWPIPNPRSWHESITTSHESWWVHDYCLLFSAMMRNLEFWIWIIQWIFY